MVRGKGEGRQRDVPGASGWVGSGDRGEARNFAEMTFCDLRIAARNQRTRPENVIYK